MQDKEEIREAVRERYGQIARAGGPDSGVSQASSCCGPSPVAPETIQGRS
ncbi:MAG: hypothetical protein GY849_15905, partial [Deltaproteobacteria bacterium]|nr:hypothetical protein [Deltaproteobacteria bacterium]